MRTETDKAWPIDPFGYQLTPGSHILIPTISKNSKMILSTACPKNATKSFAVMIGRILFFTLINLISKYLNSSRNSWL